MHVKKSKELDDNSPTKNDVKDARVIAQFVKDGRYAEPNIPQGVYAELRVARKIRDLLSVDLQAVQVQVHNWIDRYFPEFLTVFKVWEGKAAIQILKLNLLPNELINLTEQELVRQSGNPKIDWKYFVKNEKDTLSIKHIYPQTPSLPYWEEQFQEFK